MALSNGLVAVYHSRLGSYRDKAAVGLASAWDDLDSWRDDDVDTFTTNTAPIVSGLKTVTVATSAAFFALAMGVAPVAIAASDIDVDARIADAFLATWHALKEGRRLDDAVAAGRSQAEATGFDFVQSVARRTGDQVAEASGQSVRWQRVPGPNACDWCITVAGQTYHSAESADFGHSRCDCVAVPA